MGPVCGPPNGSGRCEDGCGSHANLAAYECGPAGGIGPWHFRTVSSRSIGFVEIGDAFDGRDEGESSAWDRPDKARLARVVAERLSQLTDLLRQRVVGDSRISPHRVEEFTSSHQLPVPLDQQQQRIERFGGR